MKVVITQLSLFDLDVREHLLSGTNRGIFAAIVFHQLMVILFQKQNLLLVSHKVKHTLEVMK